MTNKFLPVALSILGVLGIVLTFPVQSAEPNDGVVIPHVDKSGYAGFQDYTQAPSHRAFTIAPGGVWSWVSDRPTQDVAEAEALKNCRKYTEQPCHVYAVDDDVVLDEAQWLRSWTLNIDDARAQDAPVGLSREQRFPDLVLNAPDGRALKLSDLRGKPIFVHFWGSWCPPCQAEFTDLQKLHDALKGDDVISFVLVQGREPIAKSKRWMAKKNFDMPLYDSGHQGRSDKSFRLADGEVLSDRLLAPVYPATYILDANGLIVFRHTGPVRAWPQYEPLIRHMNAVE